MAKIKILVVDDEEALTRMLKLNLEAMGSYEVCIENRGTHALEAARNFKPDLILLDIVMPDLEGSEVAQQVKEEPQLKNTPIVFLTATVTNEEISPMGGRVGGQPFLAKPVTVQALIDCIERNLKKS